MDSITRKIPHFKVGDKYIRFSKYGGITTGEIVRINQTIVVNCIKENNQSVKYVYTRYSIVNDIGIRYDIDGDDGLIYKLDEVSIY